LHDGFDLEAILAEMNNRGAFVKIALLDAARRNPFERRFRRYSAGLAPAVTPNNTLVLYSTALGSVESDSKNDHSLFVTELLREIRTPGVSAEQSLRNAQAGVTRASKGEQVPWLSSSMAVDFSFSGDAVPDSSDGKIPKIDKISKIDSTRPPCERVRADNPPSADELAQDPVIKGLNRRIASNQNDQVAHYKRGQIYAIKHAYDYSDALANDPRSVSSLFGRGIAKQRSGADGSFDLSVAKSMDPGIVKEFAGYGVTECSP
jgi:hypothetical protein